MKLPRNTLHLAVQLPLVRLTLLIVPLLPLEISLYRWMSHQYDSSLTACVVLAVWLALVAASVFVIFSLIRDAARVWAHFRIIRLLDQIPRSVFQPVALDDQSSRWVVQNQLVTVAVLRIDRQVLDLISSSAWITDAEVPVRLYILGRGVSLGWVIDQPVAVRADEVLDSSQLGDFFELDVRPAARSTQAEMLARWSAIATSTPEVKELLAALRGAQAVS